jgi:hypothetical protein
MIRLEVAQAAAVRSPHEQAAYGRWADALTQEPRFVELLEHTAADLVHEWAAAPTTQEREAIWFKLQGLQRIVREMQKEIEHGIAATIELETAQQ